MSRVLLAEQAVTVAGLSPTFTPADGTGSGNGFRFQSTGDQYVRLKNASGSPVTATVKAANSYRGLAITEPTIVIPATTGDVTIHAGDFDAGIFNQASGEIYIELSAHTNVSGAVFR